MSNAIQLFPHSIIRISGGPTDDLHKLHVHKTINSIDKAVEIRKKIIDLKNQLNDSLYNTVSSQTDSKVQQNILNVKRDVFNERLNDIEKIESIVSYISENEKQNLYSFIELLNQYETLSQKAIEEYASEIEQSQENFKTILSNQDFQKGLILSSQTLLNRIPDYSQKKISEIKKKESQVEQGLVKYLTRMYAKTSPFSTFTNLCHSKTTKDLKLEAPFLKIDSTSSHRMISHIRINNFLFQYLRTLLIKNKSISQHFLIRINPTIQKKEDHYLYLTNHNNVEAFQRIPLNPVIDLFIELISEQSQGIGYKELIDKLIKEEYIEATHDELDAYLVQLIDYGFIEYNIGVSGIDTEWDLKLCEKLSTISETNTEVAVLIDVLKKLRVYAKEYETADVSRRKQILVDGFGIFKNVCMKLHEAAGLPAEERRPKEEIEKEWREKQKALKEEADKKAKELKDKAKESKQEDKPAEVELPKEEEKKDEEKKEEAFKHQSSTMFNFKPEQVFYEDTEYDADIKLNEEKLNDFVQKIHQLTTAFALFEGYFDEQQRMGHFFVNKYGTDATIDLLTFYEDYFREFKKAEAQFYDQKNKENAKIIQEYREKGKDLKPESPEAQALQKELNEKTKFEIPDAFKVKSIEERGKLIEEFRKKMTELIKTFTSKDNEDNIVINPEIVGELEKLIPPGFSNYGKDTSFGMFVQLFEGENLELNGTINAVFSGWGKMVSRFMHLFDDEFSNDVKKWNHSKEKENELFIEDCDASYFNANLHPPLLENEIWMPNGHNNVSADKQVPVTELTVFYNKELKRISLFHKTLKKEIFVFDLGFQGHGGRSQLFQMLDKFTKSQYLSSQPLVGAAITNFIPAKQEDAGTATKKAAKTITQQPRVMVGTQLILKRKLWQVPKELLPLRKPIETDGEYFTRVNIWRKENGMPDEVFVVIYNQSQKPENEQQAQNAKKLGRDDYKPQYISFSNPYLVNLFEKLSDKSPISMKIEEMLPNTNQLFTINGHKHITEFVVQWYC
ncbi:MAG: lantibiotic dehydratase [Bacteroidetes bacterium]|nr:lantibiotic dehydratase [Bacteroidota bacterium]